MTTKVAAARTPAETDELTRRAIGTAFAVVRAAADPAIPDAVPDGATPVLIPADDPGPAAAAIGQGLAHDRHPPAPRAVHPADDEAARRSSLGGDSLVDLAGRGTHPGFCDRLPLSRRSFAGGGGHRLSLARDKDPQPDNHRRPR